MIILNKLATQILYRNTMKILRLRIYTKVWELKCFRLRIQHAHYYEGINAEHETVRTAVGFDVAHGRILLTGPNALALIQKSNFK
jgi:hypothetical protein